MDNKDSYNVEEVIGIVRSYLEVMRIKTDSPIMAQPQIISYLRNFEKMFHKTFEI